MVMAVDEMLGQAKGRSEDGTKGEGRAEQVTLEDDNESINLLLKFRYTCLSRSCLINVPHRYVSHVKVLDQERRFIDMMDWSRGGDVGGEGGGDDGDGWGVGGILVHSAVA